MAKIQFVPHSRNSNKKKIFILIAIMAIVFAATWFLHSGALDSQARIYSQKTETVISETDALTESGSVAYAPAAASEKASDVANTAASQPQDSANQTAGTVVEGDKAGMTIEEAKAPPPPIVRDKDPATKLDEAKLYAQPQILQGKYIDISLTHQNMVLFEDGKAVDAYLVSSGKRSMPTPAGTYQIQNKVPRAWSKKYGLFMPWWMALVSDGKFGIHELPVWPGGYREGANHLGIPVSHGCVRLGVGPAKRVYDWADIGTPVIVHQ